MMTAVCKAGKKRMLAVNGRGYRIGDDHVRSILTNHEVDLVVELREDGMSIGKIATVMEVSKSCIQHILSGRNRCQSVARFVIRIHEVKDTGTIVAVKKEIDEAA